MLKFGTGGSPITSKKPDTISGITRSSELGLDFMEIEFVYGVRMKDEIAKKTSDVAKNLSIDLTIHGPYYVNLAATDEGILERSLQHILNSLHTGQILNAKSVTFHPAFYQKLEKSVVYKMVKENIEKILKKAEDEKITVRLSPEVTGKPTQFGSLEDLISLCSEIEGLSFCFDFAHLYARTNGQNNTDDEIKRNLDLIGKKLGRDFLKNMHIHLSNIEYSEKGERNHLTFLESALEYEKYSKQIGELADAKLHNLFESIYTGKRKWEDKFNWKGILKILKEYEVGGYVVCESPILEWDVLLMKDYYLSL